MPRRRGSAAAPPTTRRVDRGRGVILPAASTSRRAAADRSGPSGGHDGRATLQHRDKPGREAHRQQQAGQPVESGRGGPDRREQGQGADDTGRQPTTTTARPEHRQDQHAEAEEDREVRRAAPARRTREASAGTALRSAHLRTAMTRTSESPATRPHAIESSRNATAFGAGGPWSCDGFGIVYDPSHAKGRRERPSILSAAFVVVKEASDSIRVAARDATGGYWSRGGSSHGAGDREWDADNGDGAWSRR